MMRRVLGTVLWGALVGAILSAAVFSVVTLLDGTGLSETIGYSLIVAVAGAFLGALVGAVVGIGNFGLVGGALSGLLVTLTLVGLYVLGFGRAGEYGYFLRESGVFVVVLAVPLVAAGLAAAWLKNRSTATK